MKSIRTALLFILLVSCFNCVAQHHRFSWPELRWGIFHPFAALKVNSISKACDSIYKKTVKENPFIGDYNNGGRQDAYRHVFYMAAFAQKIKPKKIERLGKLHEKGNYRMFKRGHLEDGEMADSLSNEMDLMNNKTGIQLGAANKTKSKTELSELAITSVIEGKALIMKRNKKGNYLDCYGNVLIRPFEKKWSIPKCLVASNTPYTD